MLANEKGFTLLEIIVALTISSIILTAVFMFLNQGLFTWENTSKEGEWEQNWRVFSKELNSDLHNLFYSPLYANNIFEGNYQGMRFIIIKDDILKEVSYTVDYYSKKIIREEKIHQTDLSVLNKVNLNNGVKKTEYFSSIFRVDYEYFGKDNIPSAFWSINEKDSLPSLIKVKITRETDAGETMELTPLFVEIYNTRIYERGASIYD